MKKSVLKRIISTLTVFILIFNMNILVNAVDVGKGFRNVALEAKTVTNSEYSQTYTASKLVDGNYYTNYSSTPEKLYADAPVIPGNDRYVIIDLGAVYNIYGMKLYSRRDGQQAVSDRSNWIVQGTNDPSFQTWTTIATIDYVGEYASAWELALDEPVQYRYIKPGSVRTNGTLSTVAMAEAEIYGEKALTDGSVQKSFEDIGKNFLDYNAANFVSALDIISPVSSDKFGKDYLLTRKECAKIISYCRNDLTGVAPGEDDAFFNDVDKGSAYAPYINSCLLFGEISATENFEPDRYISVQEFIKMLLCAMRYEDYAQIKGGYPNGYLKLANSLGILPSGLNPEDNLRRLEAAKIIYNAMISPVMTYSIGSDYKLEDKDFLETSYGYTLVSGVVSANNVSNLKVPKGEGSQKVKIGNEVYSDPKNLTNQCLGYGVYCITDREGNIVSLWHDLDNKVYILETEDIADVKDGTISYYNESDKIKKFSFNSFSDTYILKNGAAFNDYNTESFMPTDGRLELIDNDGNGEIDVINIMEPQIMVVNYITDDADNNHIFIDDFNGNGIDIYNYVNLYVYRNGIQVTTDAIGPNSVVYAYVSDCMQNVRLEVHNTKVIGKIDVDYGDDKVLIDGVEYGLTDYFKGNRSKLPVEVTVDREMLFLIDSDNRVVWVTEVSKTQSSEIVAVMIDAAEIWDKDQWAFKLFTENGKIEVLYTAYNVKINGAKYSFQGIRNLISQNDKYFNGLVYVKTNSVGDIVSIKTSGDQSNSMLSKSYETTSGYYKTGTCFSSSGMSVVPIVDDIPLFSVPVDENGDILTDSDHEKYFSYSTLNTVYGKGTNVLRKGLDLYGKGEYGEPYYAVEKCVYSKLFEGVRPLTAEVSNAFLVEECSTIINEGGELTYYLYGYDLFTGNKMEAEVSDDIKKVLDSYKLTAPVLGIMSGDSDNIKKWYNGLIDQKKASENTSDISAYCDEVSNIVKGDILRYKLDNGVINELERIYSIEEFGGKSPYTTLYSLNNGIAISYVSQYRMMHRKVKNLWSDTIKLEADGNDTEIVRFTGQTMKVFVVGDRAVYSCKISEIPSYVETGDDIVTISTSGTYKAFVVYAK